MSTAERFGAAVEVVGFGQVVSAQSIMGLMMLGAGKGSTLELRAEGWDGQGGAGRAGGAGRGRVP